MSKHPSKQPPLVSRRKALVLAGAAGLALAARPRLSAAAQPKIRIGLATRTWWPSVIAETAVARGLFEKAGVAADLTIYRSGGEAVEALAAGATDMITGLVSQMATGRTRGVAAKIVALGVDRNTGWKLLLPADSPIKDVAELAGKKVGITAAGSLTDFMALWTRARYKIDFSSVPVGGGGLVPNLLARNIDAAVVYSPLSFEMLQAGQARELVDYATAIPTNLTVGWATTDKLIAEQKDLVRNTLEALYGSVDYMRGNRSQAIDIIARVNSIEQPIATQEYEETFLKLSTDGVFTMEQVKVALDLARVGGFTNLAPAEDIVTTDFIPVTAAA
ncbi:NitT/TauT family transport system substrate-binding protein [Tistlia consotensis]|uniref:NitT/TauT family transport system substrate-binding protein n=1 Tax=Tistlia consotensis USBA 355 TaxID=560819 RepID=A0A1Y6C4V5_9PROT|nr:ABC transporter substrate-binding protein [Tistlia consotensis]SMF36382.1 NitT/TauT family transport system substrate-binding protein [Tistlia consotensis USBA 355]SNR71790.1 NitT/TauT family transport system substrate-binding protein [Tistlia consotensis]